MRHLGRRVSRCAGVTFLVALLLAPLGLRGHGHADHAATTRPCAVCLATVHAPALAAAPPVGATPVLHQVAATTAASVVVTCLERPTHGGRAPPPTVAVSLA